MKKARLFIPEDLNAEFKSLLLYSISWNFYDFLEKNKVYKSQREVLERAFMHSLPATIAGHENEAAELIKFLEEKSFVAKRDHCKLIFTTKIDSIKIKLALEHQYQNEIDGQLNNKTPKEPKESTGSFN